MYWQAITLLALAAGSTVAQQTSSTSVAPDLRECYTNVTLVNRNNLPPATIAVLIDIIRKIEDNPNVNMDLRQLSAVLLHTYRQDGIEYHQPEQTGASSANVLHYSPTFHSFHRFRLLVSKLIPSNLQTLANNTIDDTSKCALHHMLSTTVDARLRGDENTCNQLSQYRALRTARQAPSNDDVEIIDPILLKLANKNGQLRKYNPKDDIEVTNKGNLAFERQLQGESLCPILGGVVSTPWGAVSAGNLIAGIAAGAELQNVPVLDLTKGGVVTHPNVPSTVSSIYPATLSGDLAEAALIQGSESRTISIGATGHWNSTQDPRYYMVQSRVNLEMTDPEIRGDIDGFVLGRTMTATLGSYSSLRLSQLIDMFYSARNGVFNTELRACNRRALSQQYITNSELITQTYAFAAALDTNIALRATITSGLDEFVSNAVTNFQTYATNNMNDLNCITTEATYRDNRLKTNLNIVVDATWQYRAVYSAISYLLDSIEVSKFGSSVTLLSAFDGSIIVNKTFSLADFHSGYTLEKHQSLFTGVNLQNTFTNIRTRMHAELEHEKQISYVGGNSSVLLFLLNTGTLQVDQNVLEQARILNETVPDLRILFATSTNQFDNLYTLVRDMHNDIMTVTLNVDGTSAAVNLASVLDRIQQVGRRIVNSNCGSEYNHDWVSGTRNFDDFVEPGYINYYSISPNYFYENNDNRRIRITRSMSGAGSLVICYSRTTVHPRQNATIVGADENSIICQTIATTGNVEISLKDACDGYYTINSCPFFYFSVQSLTTTAVTSTAVCTDNHLCRFPYNIRYQVQIEEFGCFSSASSIGAGLLLVASVLLAVCRWP